MKLRFISDYLLQAMDGHWQGRRQFPMEWHLRAERIAELYDRLKSYRRVAAQLGVSTERVRQILCQREYFLLCEARRLAGLDLWAIACPYPECDCSLSFTEGPPIPPTVCPRSLIKGVAG